MQEIFDALKLFWPLVLLQLLLMIWALIDLNRRREVKALPKWAWVLIIIFINLFGPVIYFAAGRGEE